VQRGGIAEREDPEILMAGRQVVLKLEGFDALKKAFRELEPKVAKKVIRKAVRDGMKTVQSAAKANAPVDTGRGRRKIRVRASKGPRGTVQRHTIALAVLVGESPQAGKKDATWYMWLQELGYHIGKRLRSGGKVIGYVPTKTQPVVRVMPGLHFARKAMRAKEPGVKQRMIEDILMGIEREAGR
jgi:HK97 gp10 family phage protein